MDAAPPTEGARARRVREALLDESEPRACDALPADACTRVPGNALWNVASGAASKLGEQLAGTGTVLPWVLAAVGAPAALVGLLVPIKDAGSLLPQLAVAGRLRAQPRRVPWWTAAAAVQAAALAGMAFAVAGLDGAAAAWAVLAALLAFSVASGVGSVAFQDVMAKTVPPGGRGRVLAWRASVGGLLAVAAGLGLRLAGAGAPSRPALVALVGGAAVCFAAASLLFSRIREAPGRTEGGRNALQEAAQGARLLRERPAFRSFVAVRALLLAVPLAVPFLTVFGRERIDASIGGLGVFVVANALAAALASPIWGRVADLAAHRAMAAGGAVAVAGTLYALALGFAPEAWRGAAAYAPAFLLSGIGYAGVRLGRKTWLVDAPPEGERPQWVATSNTAIGLATLAGAGVGLLAGVLGAGGTLALFAATAAAGAALAARLPPAREVRRGLSRSARR